MLLTVLGYGSIPAILALVIGLVSLFSIAGNSAIIPGPYQKTFLGRGIIRSIGGLLIYYMGLTFLALDPDTVPALNQVICITNSTAKYLFSYAASQSIETLISWGIIIVLCGAFGYYLGSNG